MPYYKKFALLGAVLLLQGCATMGSSGTTRPITDNALACSAFQPISWMKSDTKQTVMEIKQHNAAWLLLCATDQEKADARAATLSDTIGAD